MITVKVTAHQKELIKSILESNGDVTFYSVVRGVRKARGAAIELVTSLSDEDDPLIMRFIAGDPTIQIEVCQPSTYTYKDLYSKTNNNLFIIF